MTDVITPLPTFGGWRKEQGDGPGGLARGSVIASTTTGMAALILFWSAQIFLAVVALAVTAVVVLMSLPVRGLPGYWYLRRDLRWLRATVRKSHVYSSGLLSDEAMAPDGEVELPGCLASRRLALASPGFGAADEWAVVICERTRQITVSWVVDPPATDMAENRDIARFTEGYAEMLDQITHLPEVMSLAVSILTTGGSADASASRIKSGIDPDAPELAKNMLTAIADMEAAQSSTTTTVIEVVFKPQDGTLAEQVGAVARNLPPIERSFVAASIGAYKRSTAAEIAHRVRQTFDPDAPMNGDPYFRGAGPVVMTDRRGYATTDDHAIVSFVMSAAPTKDVTPFALAPLVMPTGRPVRVTVTWRPIDAATAARMSENARKPNVMNLAIAQMHLRDETKAEQIEHANRDTIAEHTARGRALGTTRIYLTTWLNDVSELPEVTREIKSKATASGIEMRPATTMHMPVACIGWGVGVIPDRKMAA